MWGRQNATEFRPWTPPTPLQVELFLATTSRRWRELRQRVATHSLKRKTGKREMLDGAVGHNHAPRLEDNASHDNHHSSALEPAGNACLARRVSRSRQLLKTR
jgi:uncharacterized protein HemY